MSKLTSEKESSTELTNDDGLSDSLDLITTYDGLVDLTIRENSNLVVLGNNRDSSLGNSAVSQILSKEFGFSEPSSLGSDSRPYFFEFWQGQGEEITGLDQFSKKAKSLGQNIDRQTEVSLDLAYRAIFDGALKSKKFDEVYSAFNEALKGSELEIKPKSNNDGTQTFLLLKRGITPSTEPREISRYSPNESKMQFGERLANRVVDFLHPKQLSVFVSRDLPGILNDMTPSERKLFENGFNAGLKKENSALRLSLGETTITLDKQSEHSPGRVQIAIGEMQMPKIRIPKALSSIWSTEMFAGAVLEIRQSSEKNTAALFHSKIVPMTSLLTNVERTAFLQGLNTELSVNGYRITTDGTLLKTDLPFTEIDKSIPITSQESKPPPPPSKLDIRPGETKSEHILRVAETLAESQSLYELQTQAQSLIDKIDSPAEKQEFYRVFEQSMKKIFGNDFRVTYDDKTGLRVEGRTLKIGENNSEISVPLSVRTLQDLHRFKLFASSIKNTSEFTNLAKNIDNATYSLPENSKRNFISSLMPLIKERFGSEISTESVIMAVNTYRRFEYALEAIKSKLTNDQYALLRDPKIDAEKVFNEGGLGEKFAEIYKAEPTEEARFKLLSLLQSLTSSRITIENTRLHLNVSAAGGLELIGIRSFQGQGSMIPFGLYGEFQIPTGLSNAQQNLFHQIMASARSEIPDDTIFPLLAKVVDSVTPEQKIEYLKAASKAYDHSGKINLELENGKIIRKVNHADSNIRPENETIIPASLKKNDAKLFAEVDYLLKSQGKNVDLDGLFSSPKGMYEFDPLFKLGTASQAFADNVKREFHQLSPVIMRFLAHEGTKVHLDRFVTDSLPDLQGTPRGYAKDRTYLDVGGLASGKSIYLSEENLKRRPLVQVVGHETGHVLDHTLFLAPSAKTLLFRSSNYSDSDEFKATYNQELSTLKMLNNNYFLQAESAGRSETLAEIIADIIGENTFGTAPIKNYMPKTYALVKSRLANAIANYAIQRHLENRDR